jgi:isopenicillin-N N-acyltransferase-like protein
MTAFPIVDTQGTPYQMGLQHGQQARHKIQGCIERLCPLEGRTVERRQHAAMVKETIAERMPAALEEMHGIAEGADMPFEDVLLMNLSVELWREELIRPSKACTLVGVAGKEALVAKTMDATPGDDRYMICHRARPSSGYSFLHLTYAGTLWTDGGVNAAGLGQSNSSLESNTCNWSGFPVFILARYLLQVCETVAHAINVTERYDGINSGGNILLGDMSGDFAALEKTVGQTVRRLETVPNMAGQVGDVIFATNHGVTEEMEPFLGGSEGLLANSQERFDNLTRRARDMNKDLEGTISLLRDHTAPGGICQHGQGGLHTIGALIALPEETELWIARGPPCQNEFRPVTLD